MAKLTKSQEKIIIAAGLDPAEIQPEKVRNVYGNQTPSMIIFTLFGADECQKASDSKDIKLLDVHDHDDDGFTNYATFCFKGKGEK